MTARQIFEAILVEMNKAEAPSLLLEDYVYFLNKTINNYINKRYAMYDRTQQTTDDLRVLKATAILPVYKQANHISNSPLYKAVYVSNLPSDYLHLVNCVCEYNVKKMYRCYDKDTTVFFAAQRLTGELWSQILNNFYMRPTYKRPYFYVNNTNTSAALPTNPYTAATETYPAYGTDPASWVEKIVINEEGKEVKTGIYHPERLSSSIEWNEKSASTVEREGGIRYGNTSPAIVEIRYGADDKVFELSQIHIDYIKTPQYVRLTQEEIDEVEDNSQILEFSDNVCYEIIRELTAILLENASDPRLQSHIPINQSVIDPQPQQPAK
jgi:hypothetical protein